MNTTSSFLHDRALVLGGGGSTGNAWLIGVVAGLFAHGLDVTGADVIIGTSAGSTAAAQITSASLAELYEVTLAAVPQQAGRPIGGPTRPVVDHLERMNRIIASASDAADLRRLLSAAALEREAAADGSWQPQWRKTVASRLPSQSWAEQRVLITAVNAETAEPVTFDRDSGVELADAVAASTASGLPYRIGGIPYLDGGYRAGAENADLARGYARVLVLSPFSGAALTPLAWGMHLSTQVDELRAAGSAVQTVFPSRGSEHLFGANAMDLSLRAPAGRLGYEQGCALAEQLTGLWN